jgi:hypothetical protein
MSRRRFIGGAAAGVAAVTATSIPGAAAVAPSIDDDGSDEAPELTGPVLARIRDVRTGELTLYVGAREIFHTDPTLARRLARAASR